MDEYTKNNLNDTILHKLLNATSKSSAFTPENMRDETITLALGATDSTSTTSATLAVLLALHPDIQERVFQEVLTILPEKSSVLTYDLLDKLQFLSQCIDETMRLYPANTVIPRETSQSIQLKGGVIVPPGVPVLIGARQIQRNEKYWGPNADKFDPTRFEERKLEDLPAASFIPFSYGPRNCPGELNRMTMISLFILYLICLLILRNHLCKNHYKKCTFAIDSPLSHIYTVQIDG